MRRFTLVATLVLAFFLGDRATTRGQVRGQADKENGKALAALDFESKERSVVLLSIGHFAVFQKKDFAKVQMDIAKAALEVTDVVVFVDEHIDLYSVRSYFGSEPALTKALAEGRLSFYIVPHDSQWIRDYGPQVKFANDNSLVLIDSAYKDIRIELTV